MYIFVDELKLNTATLGAQHSNRSKVFIETWFYLMFCFKQKFKYISVSHVCPLF